ncbi:iron-sulfur cluster biosynthesis family protein [Enterococcus faecium]|uniref:iron-sulfur cluster biosynthesis family protein n=1 Tax=Enterococcus faecium TaxID=1352 RepID=UPI00243352E7|nr:iron-sulfur cluster biosynthesis family protein [Enterococcus faecium]HCD4271758.1 iron-sulfur cluster biosynthesis family protein [Enterococcus faecium]
MSDNLFLEVQPEVFKQVPRLKDGFLLTLNDGSNQFSSAEGCCMIGDRFLLVSTQHYIPAYDLTIPCEEATVKTSEYDTTFINGHLVLEVTPSNQTIRLKNESGILDSNIQVYFDSSDAS